MKTPQTPRLTPAQAEALQARFALKISARLDEGSQDLSHDIGERLRVARQGAVAAALKAQGAALIRPAAQAATIQVAGVALAGGHGNVALGMGSGFGGAALARGQNRDVGHGRRLDDAPTSWGWRLASALPLVALLAGLWGISDWYRQEQVQAAAEVDVALLSDDLPPAAYADPGFEEYLRTPAATGSAVQDQPALQDTDEVTSRIEGALSELPEQAAVQAGHP